MDANPSTLKESPVITPKTEKPTQIEPQTESESQEQAQPKKLDPKIEVLEKRIAPAAFAD
jgi:hypothetical protein